MLLHFIITINVDLSTSHALGYIISESLPSISLFKLKIQQKIESHILSLVCSGAHCFLHKISATYNGYRS